MSIPTVVSGCCSGASRIARCALWWRGEIFLRGAYKGASIRGDGLGNANGRRTHYGRREGQGSSHDLRPPCGNRSDSNHQGAGRRQGFRTLQEFAGAGGTRSDHRSNARQPGLLARCSPASDLLWLDARTDRNGRPQRELLINGQGQVRRERGLGALWGGRFIPPKGDFSRGFLVWEVQRDDSSISRNAGSQGQRSLGFGSPKRPHRGGGLPSNLPIP